MTNKRKKIGIYTIAGIILIFVSALIVYALGAAFDYECYKHSDERLLDDAEWHDEVIRFYEREDQWKKNRKQ